MHEEYTYIAASAAGTMRCVHPWADRADVGVFAYCDGESCMGWVAEVGDDGKRTGRGRCGMVQTIATVISAV